MNPPIPQHSEAPMPDHPPSKLTVFYDSECPYCQAETTWYRFLDRKQQRICWVDITQDSAQMQQHAVTYDAAMAQLHVIRADGQRHIGVQGFYAIWSTLPVYRVISPWLRRLPFFERIMLAMYQRFAVWRLKRRPQ